MKSPRFIFLFAAVLAASLSGCVHDEYLIDESASTNSISIPFTIDGMSAGTRATATESRERRVENVYILFFDASGNYVAYTSSTVTPGFMSFTLEIPTSLTASTAYKTLIVGNADSYVPNGYQSFTSYIEDFSTKTYEAMKQDLHAYSASLPTTESLLPMWGELVDASGAARDFLFRTLSDGTMKFTGYVDFSRSVCRVDLRNLAADKLIVKQVRLCNYRTSGHFFHHNKAHGEVTTGIDDQTWVAVHAPATGSATQELKASVYTFPNISPLVSQNDETTTCLMIAGYYQDGTDNTETDPYKKLSYYRLNLAENGSSQTLRRNFLYRATIKGVSAAGSEGPKSAYEATASLLSSQTSGSGSTSDESESKILSDGNGYYLTISRSTLSFEGKKDQSDLIAVGVKTGDSWQCSWVTGEEFFSYEKVDDETLKITTKVENTTWNANSGSLKISSTANSELSYTISVTQLSAATEQTQTLTVGGMTGTYDLTLSGDASSADLLVSTGVTDGLWKCSATNGTFSGTFTAQGGHNSYLSISVPANLTGSTLTQTLTVSRINPDGTDMTNPSVASVTVNVTQAACQNIISISPTFSNNTLEIVGFVDKFSNFNCVAGSSPVANGLAVCKQITVSLADPVNCTWKAESDFKPTIDLYLTTGFAMENTNTTTANYSDNSRKATATGKHGESVWLNVFRTAPGDPDIKGNIKFSAVNSSGTTLQTVTLPVSITTPCTIDDVVITYNSSSLLIADRNLGTGSRWEETYKTLIPALNYTNDQNVVITGYSGSDYLNNGQFKGNYYTWTEATSTTDVTKTCAQFAKDNKNEESEYYKSADASKWRLPTQPEFSNYFASKMQFSKNRAFIVSEKRSDGSSTKTSGNKFVGCFFPLSGYSGYPSYVGGDYWSSTTSGSSYAYYLNVSTSSSSVSNYSKTYGYSVRCVRPLQ